MSAADPLAALRARFLARCAEDLALVRRALTATSATDSDDLRQRIHRLAGAAGMFGFDGLGDLAGRMDAALAEGTALADLPLGALAEALADIAAGDG